MLSLSPAHAATPERTPTAREPLVEGADVPSERQDLLPREVEAILRHAAAHPGGASSAGGNEGISTSRKRKSIACDGVLADRRAGREEHPPGELGDLVDHEEPLIARDPEDGRWLERDRRRDPRSAVEQAAFAEHLTVFHDAEVELAAAAGDVDAHLSLGEHEEFGRDVAVEEDVLTRWGRHQVDDLGHTLEVGPIRAAEEVGLLEHGGDLFPVHVEEPSECRDPSAIAQQSRCSVVCAGAQTKRWARVEREPTA